MKSMTCKQLGGACEKKCIKLMIKVTFNAMNEMSKLMQNTDTMNQ
jgi:hypothetical protein